MTVEHAPGAHERGHASNPARPRVDDVTAVIVNWNTSDLLDECLCSIREHGGDRRIQTIVVDNASDDGSVEMLRTRWPDVHVIENEINVGFCRANNQAIERSTSPWLLLINADAVLTPGALDAMAGRAMADRDAAIIGPRLVYGDGRFQRWTAGAEPTLRSVGIYLAGLDRLSSRLPSLHGTYLGHDTADAFRPDWVSSACMLVRKAALDDVGMLDERIFVYMDDVELCRRAREGHWSVWYEPAATVVHLMGQSTKLRTGRASPEALRSFNRYFAVHQGTRRLHVLRAMQIVGFGGRALAYLAISAARPGGHHRSSASAHFTHLKLSLDAMEERS